MKKRFIAKKKKRKISYKLFFFFIFFSIGLMISFHLLLKSNIKIEDKELVQLLLNNTNHHNKYKYSNILNKIITTITPIDYTTPASILDTNYKKLIIEKKEAKKIINTNKENSNNTNPIIYIYNTHQTEEYAASNFIEYSVKPTVQMANYILEDVFTKNNLNTKVEETKVKDILNTNGWNYAHSYKASRLLLEDAKKNNPSLKYFIDLHRDSISKEKTTIEIDGKNYAKILFIVGLEHEHYQENLDFTTKINNKLNEKYPNLSKGIYKKEGEGVNGIYNQDFSPYTILIEMGGKDNTVDEVLNSSLAFSDCFMEVIKANEG